MSILKNTKNPIIRHAVKTDVGKLLLLMKKLAVFEGYIDDFAVTEQDLVAHGFTSEPTFTAIVAERDFTGKNNHPSQLNQKNNIDLLGYLVYYLIPFTYDLKPTLFIKELYVDESARGQNLGKQLMQRTIEDAKEKGCGRLKWDVLSDNNPAKDFYKSFGAKYDERWQGFVLKL